MTALVSFDCSLVELYFMGDSNLYRYCTTAARTMRTITYFTINHSPYFKLDNLIICPWSFYRTYNKRANSPVTLVQVSRREKSLRVQCHRVGCLQQRTLAREVQDYAQADAVKATLRTRYGVTVKDEEKEWTFAVELLRMNGSATQGTSTSRRLAGQWCQSGITTTIVGDDGITNFL